MEGHVSERLIGMLAFPRMTQLDLTGPYEVFARLPNTRVPSSRSDSSRSKPTAG